MIKLLIGGSPCTHWSIAQKNNRETEPNGIGWELFLNYLIAKEKFKPDFFLYENNKSAARPIKDEISKQFGVELMYINSALVSAQNRQRFYAFNWEVEQPEDRGILLKDIIENGTDLTDNDKSYCLTASYNGAIPSNTIERKQRTMIAEPLRIGEMPKENGELSTHRSKQYRVYSAGRKSTTLCGKGGGLGAKTGLYALPVEKSIGYATPIEWNEYGEPTLAVSGTDGKTYTVYKAENGLIAIKDKQYTIKLADGYWIIRPLTVKECCRLQTLPDNYCKAVSPTQAKKGLGNGWTAEVIIHILNGALKDVPKDEEIIVLSMYDGIGTGRYCLDKMGFTNVKYYAYEVDKYAMAVANDNYPDIIQCGDAFAVRNDDWCVGRKDIPNETN